MEIKAANADALYQSTLSAIMMSGRQTAPREQRTLEVVGAHLILQNPSRNVITLKSRRLNYHFMVAEWLWMLLGMNDVDMIAPYNVGIRKFSDDGLYFRGAYGPKFIEQLPYVIEVLTNDPASRQAVITLWRERPRASYDVPCTISFQFLLRSVDGEDELDMVTYMRSNDAYLGLPYDLFNFTMIQQTIAACLGVACGTYHHMVGSLHLYERNFDAVQPVMKEQPTGLRDHLNDQIVFLLPSMPREFRAMFIGLTLMGQDASDKDAMLAWLGMVGDIPSPWGEMLTLLGHRFHGHDDMLMSPWKELIVR